MTNYVCMYLTYVLALELNGKSPFSVLALYKYLRIKNANRSINDATSKQAETKTTSKP